MANLIPPDAKSAIKTEYWLRVITVWFVLIGFGFVVTSALKIPTFVLLQTQLAVYANEYDSAKETQADFEAAQNLIEDSNNLIRLLKTNTTDTSLIELVSVLDQIAGDSVAIKSFDYEIVDKKINTINISGVADTRVALANFSDELEQDPLFSEAKLPISNLAKDSDITFNLAIILAPTI